MFQPSIRPWAGALRRGVVAAALVGLALAGCQTAPTRVPLTDVAVPLPRLPLPDLNLPGLNLPVLLRTQGDGNFASYDWPDAFLAMNTLLSIEYPYTEHKGIDWTERYERFAPRIAAAWEAEDEAAYYETLRQYAWSLYDRSVLLTDAPRVRDVRVGGSYGFALVRLADGAFFVRAVLPDSPAADVPIEPGARLLEWNGAPPEVALPDVPYWWDERPPATPEAGTRSRTRLLPRGPVGSTATLTFANPGAPAQQAMLTAVDDGYAMLDLFYPPVSLFDELDSPVQRETLAGNIALIDLHVFGPTLLTPFAGRAINRAVTAAIDAGAPAIIFDLRGNPGGDLRLVPEALQHFHDTPQLLAHAEYFAPDRRAFAVDEGERLEIAPALPFYDAPVVAMLDEHTAAAAEVFVYGLKRRGNVHVAGVERTAGTFAAGTRDIALPGGYYLTYPRGRLVDVAGQVVVEAGKDGEGGIVPDWRLARTEDAARKRFLEDTDWQREAVVERLLAEIASANPGEVP